MNVAVIGPGQLADATAECCNEWFNPSSHRDADLVWFCVDTPVNENDESDTEYVLDKLRWTLDGTATTVPVLISSQLPVGTCAKMESEYPQHHLAVQPENVRIASAVADFKFQPRMIVGTRHNEDHQLIADVLSKFTDMILFMSPESAECTKHAINAFLAMEISFANEMADIALAVGADVDDVFRGFRSDHRVGDGPLTPGGPYRGGTLGRDVVVLTQEHNAGPLLRGVKESNDLRLSQ